MHWRGPGLPGGGKLKMTDRPADRGLFRTKSQSKIPGRQPNGIFHPQTLAVSNWPGLLRPPSTKTFGNGSVFYGGAMGAIGQCPDA
jgi:hypothetical protein